MAGDPSCPTFTSWNERRCIWLPIYLSRTHVLSGPREYGGILEELR